MYSTLEERCFSRGTAVVFPSHPACFVLCVYLFDIATSYSNLISRSCSSLGISIVGVMAADFKRKPQVISRDEINFQTHQNPFGENIKMSLILSGFSANAQISFHTAWRGMEAWGLPLQIWGLEPASPWCLTGKLNVFGFGYSPHFSRAILFFSIWKLCPGRIRRFWLFVRSFWVLHKWGTPVGQHCTSWCFTDGSWLCGEVLGHINPPS